ncbi:MAG TPA: tetratricopeptide repeat protein [Bacteroidales bacterium]|nr:tetratricopeptide repeat protein [Bacteroidales bacterium]
MLRIFFILLLFVATLTVTSCNNGNNGSVNEDVLNDTTLTIDKLNKLIRQNPKNADLFIKRSELYLESKNFEEAINDLEIALKVDTLRQDVYVRLSDLYLSVGKSEKAKNILSLCLHRFPFNVKARVELAKLYLYVQMYSEAMKEIMNLEANNLQNADSYFVKALILNETEMYDDAIKSLKKTIEYNSNHWEAYNLLGMIYARQENPLAMEYFKTAVRLFPDNSEIRFNAAYVLQQFGETDKAIAEYFEAINLDSLYYQAYFNLGYIYVNDIKDYNKALEYFTEAINCDSVAYKAYYNRGYTYELSGNFKMAEADYRKALKIIPNYDPAVNGLNDVIDKMRVK